MQLRILAATALAGGALALPAAAPALAGPSQSPAADQQVSVGLSPTTAHPGDEVTLAVTSSHETSSIAVFWGHAPLSYTGHGNGTDCTVEDGYVFCPEAVTRDSFTFTVGDTDATTAKVSATVKAPDVQTVKKYASLCVAPAPQSPSTTPSSGSPSAEPSDTPSGEPSGSPTTEPTSPSAAPSESGTASNSPSAQPSLTLAGDSGGSGGGGSLPVTGTSLGLLAGGALALLGGGAAVLLLARKRRAQS